MENPVNEERTMETERGYSERYERALRLAASAHRSQNRKAGDVPYITHPFHVSAILLRYGFSTDVAIAGLLHDVVEDQGVDLGEIEERFGGRVAGFVAALSERKQDAHGVKRPWEVRKQEALEHMRQGDVEVAAIKVADALHNARSTAQDVRRDGPETWQRFNRGPESQLDYYRRILEVGRERLGDHPMVDELAEAVGDLAQIVGLDQLPRT
jgi:(p)ppGpp synthase/HD superfamily hydrolase